MDDDLAFWRELHRRLDPLRLPSPDELATAYAPRADGPAARLAEEFELADQAAGIRSLICGARGSGKTTEMLHLQQIIPQRRPGTATIYLDIASALPEKASTAVWLPLVAAAVQAARFDAPASPTPQSLQAALTTIGVSADAFSRLVGFISQLMLYSGEPAAASGAVLKGAGGAAREISELARFVRGSLQQATNAEQDHVEALASGLREQIDLYQQGSGNELVLLLDGLDRRRSAEQVLDALNDADMLYDLPAGLILSGPVQMRFDRRFAALTLPGRFRTHTLPNLPVVTPQGAGDGKGQDQLVELLQRRLEPISDPRTTLLFSEPLSRHAARMSSGLPREFLELLRLAARAARNDGRFSVDERDLEEAVRERRHDYQAGITSDMWDVLDEVLQRTERPRGDVDELLFINLVACYSNGDIWFRPNELLVDYLERRGESRKP